MDEKEGRGTCRNQQLMILHQWQFLVNLTTTVEISLLRLLRQKKYRRRKINVWRKILSLPSSTLTLLTGYSPHWKQLTPVSHHFSADSYTPTAFLHCWKYPNPPLSWSSAGNKQYWLITNSIQLTCTFTYYLLLAYYVPFFLNLRDLLNWNGSNQVRFGNSFFFFLRCFKELSYYWRFIDGKMHWMLFRHSSVLTVFSLRVHLLITYYYFLLVITYY